MNEQAIINSLPIGDLISIHLKHCPSSRLTSRGRPYRRFVKDFSHLSIHELSISVLREWFWKIKNDWDYSEKTLIHVKIALNHFFRFLVEEKIIESSPLDSIRFKKRIAPKRARVYFSKKEVKDLLSKAQSWNLRGSDTDYFYPFVYILAHTGARRSEALKLKWEDVDLELNTITFRDTKVGDDRTIIISKPLRTVLERLPKRHEHVFTNRKGKPIYKNMVQRHQNKFREDHPISGKKWGYHSLRHSFAYNYLKSGKEMYQLSAILGHHNITSTINTYGRIRAQDDEFPSPYDF